MINNEVRSKPNCSSAGAIGQLVVVLLLLMVAPLRAQDNPNVPDSLQINNNITVTQAIQISLANNTQIKRALLSIEDANQQVRTAWSEVVPEVSANANYTRNLEVPVNFIPEVVFDPNGDPNNLVPVAFGTDNNWAGGLNVSQTLFSGRAFVGVSSSKLFKAAQSENLLATAQQVVTQTRQAFYQVLIAKQQLRLQRDRMERIEQNLDDTRKRLEQGFVDEYAVQQLEVQLSNQQPQVTQAKFAVEDAQNNLLDAMGIPVSLDIGVIGSLNEYNIQSESASASENKELKNVDRMTPLQLQADSLLLGKAMELRGDLRAIDIQQKLQNKQIKAQKSRYLPTITTSYNLQWTASEPGTPNFFGSDQSRARSQTLMLNVNLPIFQGFSRDAAVQQAKIQLRDLKLQEYQAKQSTQKQIVSAKGDIREALQTASAREAALDQARDGYDRALKRYQNGLGSQQEVTDAELQLREAELAYAQMAFSYLMAKAQYDQAIGKVPFVSQNPSELQDKIELE
jgi:outer membrane protein TolC